MSPSEHLDRARRIDELVAALAAEVDAGLDDGAIASLDPDTARRLVSTTARCWAVAAEDGAEPPGAADTTPTDAVALATAALRSHDLNPFDLALWFSRSTP
ncbi:hypothetical protein [Actinomycetospora sp. TBRC 11914]|uniref:hypothetical protein n=1 Tax=Actinomycetospora sp. TBRC 11914 TaxID=2729387 RepID=UPI00145ED178|nr:hypothetical protein [Actinomycetospora sp. TBRC 11914]NMO88756.1 hypothetical protein [Actinomycetospora sp. TBRC 11914]